VTKLNGDLVSEGDVEEFVISPDSKYVVYTADQETDEVIELFVSYTDIVYLPIVLR
jgi:hypothetical protein